MDSTSANARAGAGVAGPADETSRRGKRILSDSAAVRVLMALLHDIPRAVSDRVHLAALELRRARHALLRMVVFGTVAAILMFTAWLGLWVAICIALLNLGLPWPGLLVLMVLVNGLGAWLAIRAAKALVDDLGLPATIRHLTRQRSRDRYAGGYHRE